MQTGSRLNRHLNEVEETYFEHLRHALSFALAMLWGAACCVVHAFLPFLCEKSGSRIISKLHERMVVNRKGLGKSKPPLRGEAACEDSEDPDLVRESRGDARLA